MKRMELLAFTFLLFGLVSPANGKAPDFTLSVQKSDSALELTATPPSAHHFNIDAPMFLKVDGSEKRIKPTSAKEERVLFRLNNGEARAFDVTLYLCDDAKTFCEKKQLRGKWDGKAVNAKPAGTTGPATPKNRKNTSVGKALDENGFIVNDPQLALAKAKREKKPLLIDFYGIWCPPCNMLDSHVFSSPEFKKATRRFVKLKVDADSEVSWKLKAKYRVGGYPTVIFTSPWGEEISRVVGFRAKSEFLDEVKTAWSSRYQPFSVLKAKADKGDGKAASKVAAMYLDRQQYQSAVKYFQKARDNSERAFEARVALEEDQGAEKLAQTLDAAIKKHPHGPMSIDWRITRAELHGEKREAQKRTALLREAVKTAEKLVQSPKKLTGTGYAPADVWTMAAKAQEALGDQYSANNAWQQAAAEYRRNVTSEEERGNNLELAYCLAKSGDLKGAETIYRKLEQRYPNEFTFYYNHAYVLYEIGRNPKSAYDLAFNALKHSYGDNKLRAALLVGRIEEALGRESEALKIVRKALSEAKLPNSEQIRTHRYIKKLKEFEQKVASSGKSSGRG